MFFSTKKWKVDANLSYFGRGKDEQRSRPIYSSKDYIGGGLQFDSEPLFSSHIYIQSNNIQIIKASIRKIIWLVYSNFPKVTKDDNGKICPLIKIWIFIFDKWNQINWLVLINCLNFFDCWIFIAVPRRYNIFLCQNTFSKKTLKKD